MGCDIHLFIEKKNNNTGKWEIVKGRNPDIDYYMRRSDNFQENGNIEEATRFYKLSKRLEDGSELTAKLKEIELEYPKNRRESYPFLQAE